MTDFFDEKARQVDVDSLTAFNIQLTSRYAKARELAEMLMFANYAAAVGLHGLVESVFYDSKADLCTPEFSSAHRFGSPADRVLLGCAKRSLSQFQWDGMIFHGDAFSAELGED